MALITGDYMLSIVYVSSLSITLSYMVYNAHMGNTADVADALKSIRDGLRFFGVDTFDLTDQQLVELVSAAAKGVSSAGISVEQFARAHKLMTQGLSTPTAPPFSR